MGIRNRWVVKTSEPVLQRIFTRKLGISPLLAQLLVNRGLYTVRDAREFLLASLGDLHPPVLMRDMHKAVKSVVKALNRGQRILIYGDYDVDGVTGTALLVDVLRRLGGQVEYYIPNRVTEGYGLNLPALARARESGVDLIITVDCGISAVSEVEVNRNCGGPDIIITDHHEPPAVLPDALAIINPKQPGCSYPFKELAGVGVAFKLAQACLEKLGNPFPGSEYLELVCLGTVADIVALKGENRAFVRHGLRQLNQTTRPGLQALCQAGGVKPGQMGTRDLGFILAPRLNAAGRLGDAAAAVELILAADAETAANLARSLNRMNQERQRMESDTLKKALAMLAQDPGLAAGDVLVLSSSHWHPGVIGIVASRLVDRLHKPVLMVALDDGQGKGSARSVAGFNLYRSLEYCAGCLEGYGGHEMAAGFSVAETQIDKLRSRINEYAAHYFTPENRVPVLELDALVSLQDVTPDLISEIEQLAPYGQENPNPLLGVKRARLIRCREVGSQKAHLKMLLGDHRVSIDGIGFNLGHYAAEFGAGHEVNVAFAPSINTWQGRESLQLNVKDMQEVSAALDDDGTRPDPGEEKLPAAGDLILVPETIIRLLQQLLRTRGYALAPEMHALTGAVGTTPGLQQVLHPAPPVVKTCAMSQLADLNPGEEKVLLLVNSTGHIVQYTRYINEYIHSHQDELTCVHGFMQPQSIKKIMAGYTRARGGLLMTTFNSLGYLEWAEASFDRVVLLKPPVLASDWHLLQRHATLNGKHEPWALYNLSAWEDNKKHLEELAPDREMLAMYYALLRARAGIGQTKCSKMHIMEQMQRQGFALTSWLSLVVAAAVFADLGLLQYHWQQDMLVYNLLPTGGSKRDLKDSAIFCQVHQYKAQGLDWINKSIAGNGM